MGYQYHQLRVSEQIKSLIKEVYELSHGFPKSEIYGLTSQVRRASVSILLNIVEGSARASSKDFARFITMSMGSLVEVNACLEIAEMLGYISGETQKQFQEKTESLWRQLAALRASQQE